MFFRTAYCLGLQLLLGLLLGERPTPLEEGHRLHRQLVKADQRDGERDLADWVWRRQDR